MFNNKFVQMLVDLRKSGIDIYLTDEGYKVFLLLIHNETCFLESEIMDQTEAV